MTAENTGIGQRIAAILEQRQMSQSRLEQMARLSHGYVSRLVRGARFNVSPPVLRRIAEALHIRYEWLAIGEGEIEDKALPDAARPTKSVEPNALEIALAYHHARWSASTIAAARALEIEPGAELSPPAWADLLDRIQRALEPFRAPRASVASGPAATPQTPKRRG